MSELVDDYLYWPVAMGEGDRLVYVRGNLDKLVPFVDQTLSAKMATLFRALLMADDVVREAHEENVAYLKEHGVTFNIGMVLIDSAYRCSRRKILMLAMDVVSAQLGVEEGNQ